MIVVQQETELRLVTQPDHAALAAEILALWRTDGLPEHARREELLFAVREHDNGWQEADAAPRVDRTTGRPHDFLDIPDADRRELWLRGTERHTAERTYEALLIVRHALELHRDRADRSDWLPFLASLEARRDALLEELAPVEAELDADYRWLRLADRLSLRACGVLSDELESDGRRAVRTGAEIAIDPFPLAGSTTFRVPCRTIPERVYRSDTDLAVELASARWKSFNVRLVPPG